MCIYIYKYIYIEQIYQLQRSLFLHILLFSTAQSSRARTVAWFLAILLFSNSFLLQILLPSFTAATITDC